MKAAGQKLLEMGARAVIVTGGHLERPIDVLCEGTAVETFGGEHVKSPNTHGSGCTFSSAIAAQLALRASNLRDAVILAKVYVTKAIEKSYHDRQRRRAAQPAFPLPSGTAHARRPRSSAAWDASRRRTCRALIFIAQPGCEVFRCFCGQPSTTAIFLQKILRADLCRCFRIGGRIVGNPALFRLRPRDNQISSKVNRWRLLGEASISGVPPFGLPKISNFVGGIFMPTFSASPLWSISAKSVMPVACRIPFNFSTVSSTE